MSLRNGILAVIPFSEGLDSRAVAGIMGRKLGVKLVRVRLGTKAFDGGSPRREPFTSVPYDVQRGEKPFEVRRNDQAIDPDEADAIRQKWEDLKACVEKFVVGCERGNYGKKAPIVKPQVPSGKSQSNPKQQS